MTPRSSRSIKANGLVHHVLEQGDGPVILALHGFPESSFCWRHQLDGLAARGCRVIAPDARGCGRTEAPRDVASYDTLSHVDDVVALLDALAVPKCVVVGHDWGAVTAWEFALRHPERLFGVASLSALLDERPPVPPLTTLRQRFGDGFFYILYFQEEGVAERELEANVRDALERIYYAGSGQASSPGAGFFGKPSGAAFLDGMAQPSTKLPWLGDDELTEAARACALQGFRGGLSRYRNMDRDWEAALATASLKVSVPALYITGERDIGHLYDPGGVERMKARVPDLREVVVVPGAGHWVQQEAPTETTHAIARFVDTIVGPR